MKQSCWTIFSYLLIDHQAAQEFLNSMATKGWELDRLSLGLFAKFKRTARADLTYFLDWADPSFDEDPDYVRLCADAGWKLVLRHRYWNIYASRAGVSPTPIQTDPHMEYQRFCKKALRRMFIGVGMAVLSLLLLFLWVRHTQPYFSYFSQFQNIRYQEEFLSHSLLASLLLFLIPLTLLGMLFYGLMLFWRLLFWRKHASFLVTRGIPGMILKMLSAAAILLFLLGGIADVLINGFSALHIFYSLLLGYLLLSGNGRPRESQRRRSFRYLTLLLVTLAACTFLHYPIQAYLPQRIPVRPILETSDMEYVERYDTLLGSYLDWFEPTHGTMEPFSCTVYTWASPSLAEYFLQVWSEEAVPVPGRENIWRIGRYTVIARGRSYLLLTGREVPIDEALSWLESWAIPQRSE